MVYGYGSGIRLSSSSSSPLTFFFVCVLAKVCNWIHDRARVCQLVFEMENVSCF